MAEFNNESYKSYLERTYRIMVGLAREEELHKLFIFTCAGHMMKNIKKHAKVPGDADESSKTHLAMRFFGRLINSSSLLDATDVVMAGYVVFNAPLVTAALENSLSKLEYFINTFSPSMNISDDMAGEEVGDADDRRSSASIEVLQAEETAIKRHWTARFAQEKCKLEITPNNTKTFAVNKYYNPKFMAYCEDYLLPFIALWSKILSGDFGKFNEDHAKFEIQKDTSTTGNVERYFGIKKLVKTKPSLDPFVHRHWESRHGAKRPFVDGVTPSAKKKKFKKTMVQKAFMRHVSAYKMDKNLIHQWKKLGKFLLKKGASFHLLLTAKEKVGLGNIRSLHSNEVEGTTQIECVGLDEEFAEDLAYYHCYYCTEEHFRFDKTISGTIRAPSLRKWTWCETVVCEWVYTISQEKEIQKDDDTESIHEARQCMQDGQESDTPVKEAWEIPVEEWCKSLSSANSKRKSRLGKYQKPPRKALHFDPVSMNNNVVVDAVLSDGSTSPSPKMQRRQTEHKNESGAYNKTSYKRRSSKAFKNFKKSNWPDIIRKSNVSFADCTAKLLSLWESLPDAEKSLCQDAKENDCFCGVEKEAFWVEYDLCDKWYHVECVGLDEEFAEDMAH
eukprot:gene5908-6594_t